MCNDNMAGPLSVVLLFAALFLLLRGGFCNVCAPLEFKIDTLKSAPFWWFETEAKYCYEKPSLPANATKCVFLFAVCKSVLQMCPEGSGICQTVEIERGNDKFYSWPINQGQYDTFIFETGTNSFNLSYGVALELYHSEIKIIKSTIMFKCNHDIVWNASAWIDEPLRQPRGPKAPQPVEINLVNTTSDLEYTFVFNSSEGCRIGGPVPGGGGGTVLGSLSAGSIILILFVPGVFLYCFIGLLINRGAGKTGKEMIPHSKFWFDLPQLIMDGLGFCVAKLTCQEMTSSTETYNKM